MTLHDQIINDLKQAMKQQDTIKVSVLRMLKAALLNAAIAAGGRQSNPTLDDPATIAVLQKEAKKRQESAEAFRKGQREELAQKEEQEAVIITKYLPAQLGDDAIRNIVKKVVATSEAKNFGAVMGKVMKELKGRADGNKVRQIVQEFIS